MTEISTIEMQKCASRGWFLTTCPRCGTTSMSDTHHFTAEELHRSFKGECSAMLSDPNKDVQVISNDVE